MGYELEQFFGMLTEIEMGVQPKQIVEKPEALIKYEQCNSLGLPLVAGGVMDQPHIWLLEYSVCDQATKRHNAIRAANQAARLAQAGGANAIR